MPRLILPALVDVHVHFREPGGVQKEDFASGTRAALAGGIPVVLDMPNTRPPTVDETSLSDKARIAAGKAHCDFGLFVGATAGNARQASALGRAAAGLKVYMGETFGPLIMTDLPGLLSHYAAWRGPGPIAVHAEGAMMAAAIALARAFDRPTHLCHVSTAAEIELIGRAKAAGAPITCEVTPHHLFLSDADTRTLGAFGQMRPPLGSATDQSALWSNLEVIDVFATDHAPHTRAEKEGEHPPPGVPGIETMLPLLLNAVSEGRLTLQQLVERLHDKPSLIFRLALPAAETFVDPLERWEMRDERLQTRCGWTPFAGWLVRGWVQAVALRGQVVYRDGEVLAPAGYGRDVRAG